MGSMGRSHRRREYSKARDLQAKRLLSNIGTYVPHGGGDQPFAAPQQSPRPPLHRSPPRRKLRQRRKRNGCALWPFDMLNKCYWI
ncbi:hypothetical protein ABIC10_008980 [Bradyrhizobium sp. S3.2.12]